MASIVPFYAAILAAVLGGYLLVLWIRRHNVPWKEIGLTAITGLGALPWVAYSACVFTQNEAFATWAAQNRILSPHPLHFLLGYALLIMPATWGVRHALSHAKEDWLLPVAWLAVLPFLLYVPFNLQRRLVAVAQVPLALLAAVGLQAWFRDRELPKVAYVGIAALSNLLLIAASLGPILERRAPIFRPAAEAAAMECLQSHAAPGETVLASFEVGNVIPARTDLRVFAGHGPETLHIAEKCAALTTFFLSTTGDAWRRSLLREYDLDYVFFGPSEAMLGSWEPSRAGYLEVVCEVAFYKIYRVVMTP
jgi:hypothetical protein